MKAFKTFTLPLLTIAIASAAVHAQQQPSEDAVNPQNRNPVSSQQGDQAQSNRQSESVQRENSASAASATRNSVLSTTGAGMAFEQLARTRPDQLEDIAVVAESGKELGEIEKIVTKASDSAVYAVIETEADDPPMAIRLSELEVQALEYEGSAEELQRQAYDESEFEALNMVSDATARPLGQEGATNSNSVSSSRGSPATSSSSAGTADRSTPSDGSEPLITALALSNPAQLEGKLLMGDDGEDLGSIEQIVRSMSDNDYYAVIADSQNRNQAVVRLEELELAKMSYMGSESDLEQNFRENDYQDISRN